jgi:putative effector of murein hydrolase LrgA (UPF0299 family)
MHVSKSFFRWLLLIWVLSTFPLAMLLSYVGELPPALQAYNKEMLADGGPVAKAFHQDMLAGLGEWMLPVVLLFVALLVSWVGLWMIQKWAGHLFLLVNLVGFPLANLPIAVPVENNLELMNDNYSSVVMGVILAIVYLSPLFGNEPDKQAVTAEENSHGES